ncbi:uncharacterized protein K02A2.6-like [Tigriopus californicus]|uniref:uncharacterized protein K02A2.6-like n=1 Tax=Tigriopus californicus TaxID=6832 RepID=UPI0027DA3F6C|nr:uncharacterized protein K02A2.6-like [Tigriopus californicus]
MFSNIWNEVSFDDQHRILLFHNRVIVPRHIRRSLLDKLHLSHSGITKTRSLARALYYWPSLNREINNIISSCEQCTRLPPSQHFTPPQKSISQHPFQDVSVDLFEEKGHYYLVLVDRYSGWPCISKLNKLDTNTITNILSNWLIDWGIPCSIKTDNGPQFRSSFDEFCQEMKIEHQTSSPNNPQSNGHAEAGVKAMKYLVAKSSNWQSLLTALCEWRNTPQSSGYSPAQRLLGGRQRTLILAHPSSYFCLPSDHYERFEKQKSTLNAKSAMYFNRLAKPLSKLDPGDLVHVQHPLTKKTTETGPVSTRCSRGQSYEVNINGSKRIRK